MCNCFLCWVRRTEFCWSSKASGWSTSWSIGGFIQECREEVRACGDLEKANSVFFKMSFFFLWLDSYWGRRWNRLAILLAMSLSGEARGTKPGCICQEYAMLKLLESVFKKFAVRILGVGAGVLMHVLCHMHILHPVLHLCTSVGRKQDCGAFCLFFFLWEENKGLRSEWLLLSKSLGLMWIIVIAMGG